MKAVIDTNVLLVANEQHSDVSIECIEECIRRLEAMKKDGITIIDDSYKILGEYQHKTTINPPKRAGDVFLKWLLQNKHNSLRVEQVTITEVSEDFFAEFPDQTLQPKFDAPDRKFIAVANSHPDKPPVWQAADCKWLDWWKDLESHSVHIEFLCPEDACRFYQNKFPKKSIPEIPI